LIKQVLLLALAAFSVARLGVAGSCLGGSLTTYIGLGAGGCTIGNNTLSNFKLVSPGTAFATEFLPSQVTLTPSGGNYNPSLTISVNQTATAPALLEAFFTYVISGAGYIGTSATLSGSSETVDGAVTGIENYCEGGVFGSDGVDGCPTAFGALVTLDGFQNSDSAGFSTVASINVTDDFTIDGGTAGTASGGTFKNNFAAVPEPASYALLGFGLMFAAAFRKRSKSSN
jgi:hypothetical protein